MQLLPLRWSGQTWLPRRATLSFALNWLKRLNYFKSNSVHKKILKEPKGHNEGKNPEWFWFRHIFSILLVLIRMQITFYLRWCLPFASHVHVEKIKTTATISQRLNILLSICGRKHNWFSCEKHFILQTNSREKWSMELIAIVQYMSL